LNGLKTVCLPLNKDFTSRLYEQLYEIIECKLLIICNPNNPTGTIIPLEELQKILREFTGIVVIDEAYSDFCPDVSAAHLVNEFPNLIVVQTLSKAYGMAGLRVGMAIASNDWIRALNSIKPPYNISSLVQETAIGLLESTDWSAVKQQLLSERERLFTFLKGHPQVTQVIESAANFILFRVKDAAGLYALLLKNGVIVRNRSNDYNCENCLRITIGTRSENDLFISILNTCNYD
jgi:histidinol-phosphate aminotransferase